MFIRLLVILCVQFSLCATDIAINILSDEDLNSFEVIQANIEHTGRNSVISIVSDGHNKFILKQIKDDNFCAQLDLIKEVIVSSVGCAHDIHIDKNSFIPHNFGQHLKIYKNKAATLHSYIEGKAVSSVLPLFLPKYFRLSQRFRPYIYEYTYGFEIEYGLNDVTIKSMSCHKNLPAIVALDTFFGNFDRDIDNIFYDEKSDSFYGIDQGSCFAGDLPFLPIFAYHQLVKLRSFDYFSTCSADCMASLVVYKNHLETLCLYRKEDIIVVFEKLIPLLQQKLPEGLIKNKDQYLQKLDIYIERSCDVCINIVNLLESIFIEL